MAGVLRHHTNYNATNTSKRRQRFYQCKYNVFNIVWLSKTKRMIGSQVKSIFILAWLMAPFILYSNDCCSQTQTSDTTLIVWDQDILKWKAFAGKPPNKKSIYGAECVTFIKQRFFLRNDSVLCRVQTFFNKSKSWRAHDTLTAYDLSHEMIHFDITELFARKIRKDIIETGVNEAQTQDVLKKWWAECDEYQNRYDRETNHSQNRQMQAKWADDVKALLLTFEKYRDIGIYISKPMCKICWQRDE